MKTKERDFENMDGICPIHLFKKVWGVGRLTRRKDLKTEQRIIYSPEGQQYHLYGVDAKSISAKRSDYYDDDIVYSTERVDAAKVKIHILTSILDERKNWCFDLKHLPNVNDSIKVIYDNGTIRNITFSGVWEKTNITLIRDSRNKRITPFCWKLNIV